MKKKILRWAACAAVTVFLILGTVCAVMRPAYVREAWNNLFRNELTENNIARDNGIDPGNPGDPGKQPEPEPK